jgi:hypothetical protein
VPLDLPFADGVVLIAFAHRGEATPFHPLVKLLIVFVIVSGVSLIFTGHTLTDAAEFISWTFTTVVVISFAETSSRGLARVRRIYVHFVTLTALLASRSSLRTDPRIHRRPPCNSSMLSVRLTFLEDPDTPLNPPWERLDDAAYPAQFVDVVNLRGGGFLPESLR